MITQNTNNILQHYLTNLNNNRFQLREKQHPKSIEESQQSASFGNNLKNIGEIIVSWQDANQNERVDTDELTFMLQNRPLAIQDIPPSVLAGFATIVQRQIKPSNTVNASIPRTTTEEEVIPTESSAVEVNNIETKGILKSSTAGKQTPLTQVLKSQTDSSHQLYGLAGCVVHASVNALMAQLKSGVLSPEIEDKLNRAVSYNSETKAYTFTPSAAKAVVITKQMIDEAKRKYKNMSNNNDFAVATELAWLHYFPNTKGVGNQPQDVLNQLFDIEVDGPNYTNDDTQYKVVQKTFLTNLKIGESVLADVLNYKHEVVIVRTGENSFKLIDSNRGKMNNSTLTLTQVLNIANDFTRIIK